MASTMSFSYFFFQSINIQKVWVLQKNPQNKDLYVYSATSSMKYNNATFPLTVNNKPNG